FTGQSAQLTAHVHPPALQQRRSRGDQRVPCPEFLRHFDQYIGQQALGHPYSPGIGEGRKGTGYTGGPYLKGQPPMEKFWGRQGGPLYLQWPPCLCVLLLVRRGRGPHLEL